MTKRRWVVRVVIPAIDAEHSPPLAARVDGRFLECLRYAGLVRVHHDDEERQTFDLVLPNRLEAESRAWAEANAARMWTLGYNAVAAPSTDPIDALEANRPVDQALVDQFAKDILGGKWKNQ